MRALTVSMGYLILGSGLAFSQEVTPRFEVATVKQAARFTSSGYSSSGGPGTADPGRFTYKLGSLRLLLLKALGVKDYQLSGPDWLDSEGFEVVANVPPGTTKDQFAVMLQSLVVERFNLTFHHEAKQMAVYELTVGKDGPKLKESDLSIQRAPGLSPPVAPDKNGCPQRPPGPSQFIGRMTDGIMCWTSGQQPISGLTKLLENELDRPVVDKTGLTKKYDIKLAYSRDGLKPILRNPAAPADGTLADDIPSGGPSLQKALQDQLGLRLESAKDPIDILVIDHIDKMPTEN